MDDVLVRSCLLLSLFRLPFRDVSAVLYGFGDEDDGILLQSFRLDCRIRFVYLVDSDIVCLADGIQCLALENYVRIVDFPVHFHLFLRYGHWYRCVLLGIQPGRHRKGQHYHCKNA